MIKTKKNLKLEELEMGNKQMRVECDVTRAERDFERRRADFYEKEYRNAEQKPGWTLLIVAVILSAAVTALVFCGVTSDAATVDRYTTQTVALRDKAGGKVVKKVKRNTKVAQIREGKRWAVVRHKGEKYVAPKKYLNPERIPGKKKSREYIRYLRTKGPVYWHGRKYTYYTSRICPIYKLPVPGLHLDADGIWCDKNDYIVLGSSVAYKKERKILATPFGKFGRVYDTGGYSTPPTLCDTATSW